jgi:Tol biopolymer transport system component
MEFDRWSAPSLSPDGKFLVFSAAPQGFGAQLWIRPIDSLAAKLLPGTKGAEEPFWSPDSRWIAFFSDSKLKKISVDGGSIEVICDGANARGGTWGQSDKILFVPGTGVPVHSVPASGGKPAPVTELEKSLQELTHRWPVFLPDGNHFLFFSRGRENAIYAASIESKERKLILKNDTNALYVSPGYLLFVKNGVLMAQPFNADRLELSGSAVAVADSAPVYGGKQEGLFSASENGILAIHAKVERLAQLVWVDPSGKVLEVLGEPGMFEYGDLNVSPDGKKIAFSVIDGQDGTQNIWIYEVASHQRTRLTFEKLIAQHPLWAPDGSRIVFTTNRLGAPQIFSIPAKGIGEAELFLPSDQSEGPDSWSPDGKYLISTRAPADKMLDQTLWVLPLADQEKPHPLFNASHSHQWNGAFSPDGKWIAYQSNESSRSDVYIVPFPNATMKMQVSKGGGWEPHWSPDGRELYYVGAGGTMMAAALLPGKSGLQIGESRTLFKMKIPSFDVSRDGKRFLIYQDIQNQETSSVTLITNWTKALKQPVN